MPKILANKIWKKIVDGKVIEIHLNRFYDSYEGGDRNKYLKAKELKEPVSISNDGSAVLFGEWLFRLNEYEMSLGSEKLKLILLELIDKEREKFERLAKKFTENKEAELDYSREPIPEDVRILVWRRDGGRCVKCNSQERLEYDHVIPISKGGSNTARNIQILCEKCNRAKSNNV